VDYVDTGITGGPRNAPGGGASSNATRVIASKDYEQLLRLYGEQFWPLLRDEFVEGCVEVCRGVLVGQLPAQAIVAD
jgi:hypothetical protein